MKAYKLTNQDCMTQNNALWEVGVTKEISLELQNKEAPLCSESWFHFYKDPLLAVLMNPVHASIEDPRLWLAEASGLIKEEPLKSGTTCLTIIKELKLPVISTAQRIGFGILCTKYVNTDPAWIAWADNWLSGKDRSKDTAAAAAAYATVNDAFVAAYIAASAASAAYAASVASAAYAASAASAYAASAAKVNVDIDFITLAKQALTIS